MTDDPGYRTLRERAPAAFDRSLSIAERRAALDAAIGPVHTHPGRTWHTHPGGDKPHDHEETPR